MSDNPFDIDLGDESIDLGNESTDVVDELSNPDNECGSLEDQHPVDEQLFRKTDFEVPRDVPAPQGDYRINNIPAISQERRDHICRLIELFTISHLLTFTSLRIWRYRFCSLLAMDPEGTSWLEKYTRRELQWDRHKRPRRLFVRIMKVAEAACVALRTGMPLVIRTTQYQHKSEITLKNHDSWVREAVEIIAFTIGVKQWELGVLGFGGGEFCGAGFWYKTGYDTIFGSDTLSRPIPNPSSILEYWADPGLDGVLLVEDRSMFDILVRNHLIAQCRKDIGRIMLFTPSGYGDYATRYWGNLIQSHLQPGANIAAITDPNIHGLRIYMVMKFGSVPMQADSDTLTMPSLRRIGVNIRDIPKHKCEPLDGDDINLAEKMLSHPNIEDSIIGEMAEQLATECRGQMEYLGNEHEIMSYVLSALLDAKNSPRQPVKPTQIVQDLEAPLVPMARLGSVEHLLTKLEVLAPTASLMRMFKLRSETLEPEGQELEYSNPSLPISKGSWSTIVVTRTKVAVSRHSILRTKPRDGIETIAQSYDTELIGQIFTSFKGILKDSKNAEVRTEYSRIMANLERRHQLLSPVWYGTGNSKSLEDLLCLEWAMNKADIYYV